MGVGGRGSLAKSTSAFLHRGCSRADNGPALLRPSEGEMRRFAGLPEQTGEPGVEQRAVLSARDRAPHGRKLRATLVPFMAESQRVTSFCVGSLA